MKEWLETTLKELANEAEECDDKVVQKRGELEELERNFVKSKEKHGTVTRKIELCEEEIGRQNETIGKLNKTIYELSEEREEKEARLRTLEEREAIMRLSVANSERRMKELDELERKIHATVQEEQRGVSLARAEIGKRKEENRIERAEIRDSEMKMDARDSEQNRRDGKLARRESDVQEREDEVKKQVALLSKRETSIEDVKRRLNVMAKRLGKNINFNRL